MNDLAKNRMQEKGNCAVDGMTVIELIDICNDLGIDPGDTVVTSDWDEGVLLYGPLRREVKNETQGSV